MQNKAKQKRSGTEIDHSPTPDLKTWNRDRYDLELQLKLIIVTIISNPVTLERSCFNKLFSKYLRTA